MTTFSFGHRTTVAANTSTYLPGTGGTNQAAEISLIIPKDGTLKNLYWDCQSNGLTGTGNKFTIKVGGVHATPTSAAPALADALVVSIDGKTNGTAPFNFPVVAGQRIGVQVQNVAGGTSISRLRVSFELEPTASGGGGSEIFEAGGKVGIGTSNPQEKLTLAPDSDFAIEMPIVSGITTTLQVSGSLPADDYFFMISASDGIGWTMATNEIPVTLGAGDHSVKIDWNPIPGAVRYRVYRALVSGGPYKYIETPYNTYEYSGDGDFNDSGTPPAATTAYFNKLSASGTSWLKGGNVGIGTANPQEKLTISQESDLAVEMTVPTLLSATLVDGGALPPDNYYFKIVAEDGAGGKTIASNELSCTIVAGSPKRSCQLAWTAVLGVKSYLVYIGDDIPGGQDRCYRVLTNSYLYIGETSPLPWVPIPSVTTAYINKFSAVGDSWLMGGKIGIGTTVPRAQLDVTGSIRSRNSYGGPDSFAQRIVKVQAAQGNFTHIQLNVSFGGWASYTYRIQVASPSVSYLQMGGGYTNGQSNFSHVITLGSAFNCWSPHADHLRFDLVIPTNFIHPVCVFEVVGGGWNPIGDGDVSIAFG